MKNINVKVNEVTLENLKIVQTYYSSKLAVSFSQAETLSRLLQETANLIKNTGETYSGRDWTFERQEFDTHRKYLEQKEKEEKCDNK